MELFRRCIVLVDQAAVEGDAGLQVRIVGRIVPHVAAAAAEADDAEPVGVAALRLGPGHGGVEIGEQLGVGLGVNDREQLWQVVDLGQVDAVGFGAEIIIRRDRKGAEMADAAGDVFDPLVQAEDFHADQNDRRVHHVGRAREIDRHVAAGDRDGGHAGVDALGVGLDGVSAHRAGGERIPGGGRRRVRHEAASRQRRHHLGQPDEVGRQLWHVHEGPPAGSAR